MLRRAPCQQQHRMTHRWAAPKTFTRSWPFFWGEGCNSNDSRASFAARSAESSLAWQGPIPVPITEASPYIVGYMMKLHARGRAHRPSDEVRGRTHRSRGGPAHAVG